MLIVSELSLVGHNFAYLNLGQHSPLANRSEPKGAAAVTAIEQGFGVGLPADSIWLHGALVTRRVVPLTNSRR